MKNVQVIDGAENCKYSVYEFTDGEFEKVFPAPGQDVEFIEDVIERLGEKQAGMLLAPVWKRIKRKAETVGIHGTLFYELRERKKKFYPTKREAEMIVVI